MRGLCRYNVAFHDCIVIIYTKKGIFQWLMIIIIMYNIVHKLFVVSID